MEPHPQSEGRRYRPADKLLGRRAIITGGDSGIGRAVSSLFAQEGADVAIAYLEERDDAQDTRGLVEQAGRKCLLLQGDVGDRSFCDEAVEKTVAELAGLDIVVNNAAEQHPVDSLAELTDEQLQRTFRTNLFSQFYLTRAALGHLRAGSAIVCTTSVTAYQGHKSLIDYSATKGAIVAFIRSLSQSLAEKGIRVNGVAPGPIWTPLIPASFPAEKVDGFGENTLLGRPGQPDEIAPCYVYLACDDSSYMTGQVLHPNGGRIVNG
jgi:NAD(P)-dependent dehydrogenase (short-subunit alcohol dehydrogenase family)